MSHLERLVASLALLGLSGLAGMNAARADDACVPHVEENAQWRSATLRPDRDGVDGCVVGEGAYRRVLRQWLAARDQGAGTIESVALGRAIRYPWISEHLATAADASEEWNVETASLRSGHVNAFVAKLLGEPAFLERLDRPFEGSAYSVVSVSVEKVLVDEVATVLPGSDDTTGRVPYDAQLWLVLEARR